jgi:hypothetical protein
MTGQEFDGVVDVAITFFAAGRMYRTDWFRFNVLVHNGHILRVEAVTLPARRVRVAHGREHQVELEPVRDASEPESKSTNA